MGSASIGSLGRLFEDDEIVVAQQVGDFVGLIESRLGDFGFKYFLTGAHVIEDPVRARSGDAFEIDQDNTTTGTQGAVEGRERIRRVFKVVIHVTNKCQIDRIGRELRGAFGAEHGFNVLPSAAFDVGMPVGEEFFDDIDGVDFALLAYGGGKSRKEKAGARADVGNLHPGFDTDASDNGVTIVGDFAAFALEAFHPTGHDHIFAEVGGVDAGVYTRFLGENTSRESEEKTDGETGRGGHGSRNDSDGVRCQFFCGGRKDPGYKSLLDCKGR